jgi:hypothetical protein
MKIQAPFRVQKTLFGKIVILCYGLVDDRLACSGHLNSWEREWWFYWGWSRRDN